jgi:translation elongation factor EF-Ts
VSVDEVNSETTKTMIEEFTQELKASWKPDNVIEGIVKWKLNKVYSDFVLLEQEYIRDWAKKIKDILPEWFKINSFIRISVY